MPKNRYRAEEIIHKFRDAKVALTQGRSTVGDASGQSLMVGGEQLQQGYAFKTGAKSFDVISSTCNINHVSGRDGNDSIKTFPGVKGEARFHCSPAMGTPDETWNAKGAHLFCQLTSITVPNNRGANNIQCEKVAETNFQLVGVTSHHPGFENEEQIC